MIAVPALVIRRVYAASPEKVYEAWITPEIAARFMGPDDVVCEIVEMDPRPGGRYRLIMHSAEDMPVTGTYREVVPGRKLVMTWRWEEDDPKEEYDSLLTLEFHPHEGGTEFILTHGQLATERSRANHRRGWTSIVDKLASAVAPV